MPKKPGVTDVVETPVDEAGVDTAENTVDTASEEIIDETPVVSETILTHVAPNILVSDTVNEIEMNAMTASTGYKADTEEKVPFFLPLQEGMKAGTTHTATVNGLPCTITRNVQSYIPKMFEEIFIRIRDSEAGLRIRKDLLHDRANPIIN